MNKNKFPVGQISDYEIKHLKIFKTIADCGGFSAAESVLNISRSTISIHISNLEARLNQKLCHRGRSGFSLTEEGQIVYEATVKLLGQLEEFRITIHSLDQNLSGSLKLVCSDAIILDPRSTLSRAIDRFHQITNDVHICIEVDRMAEIEQQVLNEEADIGIIPFHRALDGLDYHYLYTDTCYLYCSTGNPVSSLSEEELTDDLINSLPAVHAGFKAHENINAHLINLNLRATAYSYETRLALIFSSQYIGFLPSNYAQPWVAAGKLKPLAPARRSYRLDNNLITRRSAKNNKIRNVFLRVLESINA